MTDTLHRIRRLLVAGLYLFVVAVAAGVLLRDPTSDLVAVPVAAAALVAAHALRADTLDGLGYAVGGFLAAAVVVLALAAASAAGVGVPSPSDAVAMPLVAAVLLAAYALALRDGGRFAGG
ncbi:hypothetical protein [Halostella salina]|uniref:hypothetical protein n=1 Tax=Halostella salina TaxID=1547897 RepID=UPI000EF7FE1A|nr:hypothetical protein [Halostella salina]